MRKITPYEQNLLLKNKISASSVRDIGDMPLEYFIGKAEFRDRDFFVNKNVLIPRIESEQMLDLVLKNLSGQSLYNIIDIGAGSGAIGISTYLELQQQNLNVHLTIVDVSATALEVAQKNVNVLIPLAELKNISLVLSDLFFVRSLQETRYDFILANLPYIPTDRIEGLDSSVKDYEPPLALDGGKTGLDLIYLMLYEIRDYDLLTDDGKIILEIDETHDVKDFAIFPNFAPELVKDEFGLNRFIVLKKVPKFSQ